MDSRQCFAQIALPERGLRCTILEETYPRGTECPFAKEKRGDKRSYRMERMKQREEELKPKEEKKKRKAVYRTSSGVIFG